MTLKFFNSLLNNYQYNLNLIPVLIKNKKLSPALVQAIKDYEKQSNLSIFQKRNLD